MVLLLLLLIPAVPVLAAGLIGYGLGSLGRAGVRRADRLTWLRSTAALLGAAAAAVYTWGLLALAGATLDAEDHGVDSSPPRPCRTPGLFERAVHVVDYTVRYAPLRFVCRTSDGGSYVADAVPGYVNPAVLGLGAGAVACAGAGVVDGGRRVRLSAAA